jgi:hypothetical protein
VFFILTAITTSHLVQARYFKRAAEYDAFYVKIFGEIRSSKYLPSGQWVSGTLSF